MYALPVLVFARNEVLLVWRSAAADDAEGYRVIPPNIQDDLDALEYRLDDTLQGPLLRIRVYLEQQAIMYERAKERLDELREEMMA